MGAGKWEFHPTSSSVTPKQHTGVRLPFETDLTHSIPHCAQYHLPTKSNAPLPDFGRGTAILESLKWEVSVPSHPCIDNTVPHCCPWCLLSDQEQSEPLSEPREQRCESRVLHCHDMKGGYCKEADEEYLARFDSWNCIDKVVYFSHQRIAVPPKAASDVCLTLIWPHSSASHIIGDG